MGTSIRGNRLNMGDTDYTIESFKNNCFTLSPGESNRPNFDEKLRLKFILSVPKRQCMKRTTQRIEKTAIIKKFPPQSWEEKEKGWKKSKSGTKRDKNVTTVKRR